MKTKLKTLIIGLAMLAGVLPALAQVTNLGIAPAGHQSVLYWPVSATNYVLQTVTNLSSTNWVSARNAFAVNAAQVTNAAPAGFFKLLPATAPAGMALIPAGWFLMGDALGDGDTDASPTNIYVSTFFMDVNLVSYGLWTNVYAYSRSHGYGVLNATGAGTNYPVQEVDWYDSVIWCNARSQQEGLTPCYYSDAAFTILFKVDSGGGFNSVFQNMAANGYRLPTEAEWEKAARGGGIGLRFPWGNNIHANQAQYFVCTNCFGYDLGPSNSVDGPAPAGSFDVNGYGLKDMAGNVYEWCWDYYGTPYGQPANTNPTGPASGDERVVRGGSWGDEAAFARCAYRGLFSPDQSLDAIGFRCVRGP